MNLKQNPNRSNICRQLRPKSWLKLFDVTKIAALSLIFKRVLFEFFVSSKMV